MLAVQPMAATTMCCACLLSQKLCEASYSGTDPLLGAGQEHFLQLTVQTSRKRDLHREETAARQSNVGGHSEIFAFLSKITPYG